MITYKFTFKDEHGYYNTINTVANDQARQEYIDRQWRETQSLCINYSKFIYNGLNCNNHLIKTK